MQRSTSQVKLTIFDFIYGQVCYTHIYFLSAVGKHANQAMKKREEKREKKDCSPRKKKTEPVNRPYTKREKTKSGHVRIHLYSQ